MKTKDFHFDLPEELIAQRPSGERGGTRLLVLDRATGSTTHSRTADLHQHLPRGALVVFNDSRVRKARIYGISSTGGRVEFLLLRRSGELRWLAMTSKAKRQSPGKRYMFPDGVEGEIVGIEDGLRILLLSREIDDAYLEKWGHIPLPPYIRREDDGTDAERYQTIYSRAMGSVAAPTAGLHFTETLLKDLAGAGIETAYITLHVGLGTFLPVRVKRVEDHEMHEEEYTISETAAEAVNRARDEGRPVVAVGTTSVRTLESAWGDGGLLAGTGSTRIFLFPGYRFRAVDALFTNFHTPESTLIMLVAAFAGRDLILRTYQEAVRERYRFFSYGDAMLIR
ncbi:MAG TPA: tRNA preQ1(34) S-adenosylmethionine ribosyltransferase-isomerase QueA [Magnetospirillaceae bacterium]|nr:tRNA preQ1(34) S-adenosylmethionine ribosyltransferase-isomerase QueA [Magnetospirillaceae bacterium]